MEKNKQNLCKISNNSIETNGQIYLQSTSTLFLKLVVIHQVLYPNFNLMMLETKFLTKYTPTAMPKR